MMFIAEEHNEMTPAQFLRFLTGELPIGSVIILSLLSGCISIAVGKKEFDKEPFTTLEGVPLVVLTEGLTDEQIRQVFQEGQSHFAKQGPIVSLKIILELNEWLNSAESV